MSLRKYGCAIAYGIVVLIMAYNASASQVIWSSAWYGFVPLGNPDTPFRTMSLDYGSPNTLIGDQIKITASGIYDLSTDAEFPNFLALATDSQSQDVTWKIDGVNYQTSPEHLLYMTGALADLGSFGVDDMQINVIDFSNDKTITMRWEFTATPEPVSASSMVLVLLFSFALRRRPCITLDSCSL